MAQCLGHREIGIMELHIFTHETNGNGFAAAANFLNHLLPLRQIRQGSRKTKFPADNCGQVRFFQHQRCFVQNGNGDVFNDAIRFYVAEHTDFLEDTLFQGLVAAQNNDIRLHTHTLQFPNGVLCRLGFVLIGAPEERNQCHMDEQTVLSAHLQGDLTDCLQKGLGFNITDGTSDFRDDNIGIGLLAYPVDKLFNFVGDMRDDLNGGTQIFAFAFLIQNIPVHFSGGKIGILVQVFVNESFVMAQVKVGFCTILSDIDFTMLVGAHGAGVYIDIGVKLLRGHFQTSGFQQPPQ